MLTVEYKLKKPTKAFVAKLDEVLWACRDLYNNCLEDRRIAYQEERRSVGWVEQSRKLTTLRSDDPRFGDISRDVQTQVIKRLDKAYQFFFKRGGFPRFQGRDRYSSFEWAVDQRKACPIRDGKLFIPNVGNCRVRLSRELPGKVKVCRILRRIDGWYVQAVCETENLKPLPKADNELGIDMGISRFLTDSDGNFKENIRPFQAAQEKLAEANRSLARKTNKRSKRRKLAKLKLQKTHLKVARVRKHWHYQVANDLVKRADLLVVEDLSVKQMVEELSLPKQILDVAWSSFIGILMYKAASAGRVVIKVDPAYTSQTCSVCGYVTRENRRTQANFTCVACSHSEHADVNAAKNILARGKMQLAKTSCKQANEAVDTSVRTARVSASRA